MPDEFDGRPTIHEEASAHARDIPEDAAGRDAADDADGGGDESE
jgi:hypothetical protein